MLISLPAEMLLTTLLIYMINSKGLFYSSTQYQCQAFSIIATQPQETYICSAAFVQTAKIFLSTDLHINAHTIYTYNYFLQSHNIIN